MSVINTKSLMSLGFGAIILLMILIIVISLKQMNLSYSYIQQVVNNNNTKTSLVSTMLIAARERTISIQKIVNMDDPFERDDEFMLFNRYGLKFLQARTRLKSFELTPEEEALIAAQGEITNNFVVPLQREIVDLAMSDRLDEARQILRDQVISNQNEVVKKLYLFLSNLEKSSNQAVYDVSLNLQESKNRLVVIVVIISLLSLFISWYVIRKIEFVKVQLFREKEKAQVTLHSIGEGVIRTDRQGVIEYMNSMAKNLTGYSSDKACGQPLQNIFPISSEVENDVLINPFLDVVENQQTQISDRHAILKNVKGVEYGIEYTASPIHDYDQTIIGVVLVFRNVTSVRAMANQLSYQAAHDGLTGLINRREFESRIKLALQTASIDEVEHSLCYLDLDQFKVVNDTCGHVAGDELLRQLSKLLKHKIREGDALSRLGGDEFGVLYLNCSMVKAEELAEALRRAVNDFQFNWNNRSFSIGVSIGIVQINMHGNMNSILSAADSACYIAKEKGRNRIHCYKEDDNELIEREGQMQWVHRINLALEEGRFILYCQPIYHFSSDACNHYEILVRLIDEKNDVVPPMAFIPAAERYNLMSDIDRWIFSHALIIIKETLDSMSNVTSPMFAINLSAQSLCDDGFLMFVETQLEINNVNPELICFEITETSVIVNLTRAQHFIKTLKKLGVKFSLDDFGSGLSSFAYLKNLPVDFLKIDGAFVRDIIADPIDMALVESINQVGHIMGIKTIAEYVENREIFERLSKIGVDYAQGYYICKPFPLKDITQQEPIRLS